MTTDAEPSLASAPSRDWLSWVLGAAALALAATLWFDARAEDALIDHQARTQESHKELVAAAPWANKCKLGDVADQGVLLRCPWPNEQTLTKLASSPGALTWLGSRRVVWLRDKTHAWRLAPGGGVAERHLLGDRAFFEAARRRQIRP